jgi:hypothetical protein
MNFCRNMQVLFTSDSLVTKEKLSKTELTLNETKIIKSSYELIICFVSFKVNSVLLNFSFVTKLSEVNNTCIFRQNDRFVFKNILKVLMNLLYELLSKYASIIYFRQFGHLKSILFCLIFPLSPNCRK